MDLTSYFILLAISLAWLIFKYHKSGLYILIILLFYHGLFAHYGKDIENAYKIFVSLFTVFYFFKLQLINYISRELGKVIFLFFLFSFSFVISGALNNDPWSVILSQYFYKYVIVLIFFFLFRGIYKYKPYSYLKINKLIVLLLVVQILFSIYKLFAVGLLEGIVGSISSTGGAVATTYPIIALCILFISRKGNFKRLDWLIVFGIFIIAFSSNKRAIWFIMPLMLFLLYYYVQRKKVPIKLFFLLPLIPLVFYFGVRLNPTLNPDEKIWGRFDINYVFEYSANYSLGKEEVRDDELAYGRISSTSRLAGKILRLDFNENDFYGQGQKVMRYTDYDEFLEYDTGLGTKMAITGFYRTYLTTGLLGILFLLLWYFTMYNFLKNKHLKYAFGVFIIWDYFFYHGTSVDHTLMMVLVIYLIWFSNSIDLLSENRSQMQTATTKKN